MSERGRSRSNATVRPWASAVGLALSICVTDAAPARANGGPHGPWQKAADARDVGPRPMEQPAGFIEARDAAELAEWLRDPAGPSKIWLGAKTYTGNFEVTRPLSLRGALGAVLRGTGTGTVLTISADDTDVENLAIEHSGRRNTTEDAGIKANGRRIRVARVRVRDSLFGIALAPCRDCTIEGAHVIGAGVSDPLQGDGIKLWEADDSHVRANLVEDSRDLVVWYSRRVTLERNTVRGSRYGLHFMYAHDSTIRANRIENNVVGAFVMYSARLHLEGNLLAGARGAAGVGVGFKESDGVVVTGNAIVANTTGAYLDGTPRDQSQPVVLKDNLFALNDVGVRFHGANQGLAFRNNTFQENTVSAEVEGGGDALGTEFSGNRWHDYVGYDLDRDGTGDVPYEVKRLSGELTDAQPSIKFFQGTLAMGLMDAIAEAVPVLASRLLLVDRTPRVASARSGPALGGPKP